MAPDAALFDTPIPVRILGDRASFDFLMARKTSSRLAVEALLLEDQAMTIPRRVRRWRATEQSPARSLPGYCRFCGTAMHFTLPSTEPGAAANFTEALLCAHCGLNNRPRFMASHAPELQQSRGKNSRIYAYEQATAFFDRMHERLRDRAVVCEYLDPGMLAEQVKDGGRHEGATSLSFSDASCDVLVSNDVFEHVPDIGQRSSVRVSSRCRQ